MKQAVLFAVAGTSCDCAAEAFRKIDRMAETRFPGVTRRWAYTSGGVRRKLASRGGAVEDPATALVRLREEGVTHLAVQSLHMVEGMEYSELRETLDSFAAGPNAFQRATLGQPMLEVPGLFPAIVSRLLDALDLPGGPETALLLVAHGSRRPAARHAYAQAAAFCRSLDKRVVLGTLMEPLEFPGVVEELRKLGVTRAVTVPFTIAAGKSATREIAGPDPASWETQLAHEGIACDPVLRGLGDYDAVAELWLNEVEGLLRQVSAAGKE